jgi:SAM-dependent methyltransferase
VTRAYGPEISDLVVDYDPETLERRPVLRADVLARLEEAGESRPIRVVRSLPAPGGVIDPDVVDGVLVRSHLELQRLHEEFRVGAFVRDLVRPMLDLVRRVSSERPIRLVDIGCGLGFVARWLAHQGGLGDDVEIIGADYNRAFVEACSRLARAEGLACRFVAANAFRLSPPAHVYMSTGVAHHFRGADLTRLFAEHARAGALGFVHVDIRPWFFAPIGSWIFHEGRMREPLARWDGYWSAVRAHDAETLRSAAKAGAPSFATATFDATCGMHRFVRIFQALLGMREEHRDELFRAYAAFGSRLEATP